MNSEISLDKKEILDYQNNFGDYLMIDCVTKIKPGEYAQGYKDLIPSLWFFKFHWPEDPNMPGALQLEALSQMASLIILAIPENKKKILYFTSHKYTQFKRKVIPGDRLIINSKVIKWSRGIGNFYAESHVNDKLTCKSEFTLVLPDVLKKFSL